MRWVLPHASAFDTTSSTKSGPIPLLSFHNTKNKANCPINPNEYSVWQFMDSNDSLSLYIP